MCTFYFIFFCLRKQRWMSYSLHVHFARHALISVWRTKCCCFCCFLFTVMWWFFFQLYFFVFSSFSFFIFYFFFAYSLALLIYFFHRIAEKDAIFFSCVVIQSQFCFYFSFIFYSQFIFSISLYSFIFLFLFRFVSFCHLSEKERMGGLERVHRIKHCIKSVYSAKIEEKNKKKMNIDRRPRARFKTILWWYVSYVSL